MKYKAVVIGASAGGNKAIRKLVCQLPEFFPMPIIIVQHIKPVSDNFWIESINAACKIHAKEADEKEEIKSGTVYFAPPGYHLLVEKDFTFSLSSEERVNFSRPSIDVLFETAADAYKEKLIGIVLTGANSDGAEGLRLIKANGGLTIVQDPETAEAATMPLAAIKKADPGHILALEKIVDLLISESKT